MSNLIKAVGETIAHLDKKAKMVYTLICLDNNQANKYNYKDNGFEWHNHHPLSGVRLSRRGATLRQPQMLVYPKLHKMRFKKSFLTEFSQSVFQLNNKIKVQI